MTKAYCSNVELQKDGSLYFVLNEEGMVKEGEKSRFMECVIEYEDGEFILRANDHIVVRF